MARYAGRPAGAGDEVMNAHEVRERWARHRPRAQCALLLLLAGVAAACGGGGAAAPTPQVRLLSATIGPEGGRLAFPAGPHEGVALDVPPGAVAAPVQFSLEADVRNARVLSMFPVYRCEPRTLAFAVPVTMTIRIGDGLVDADGSSAAVCFQQPAADGPWRVQHDSVVTVGARTVSTQTERLGDFVAWSGGLHRLLTQEFTLLDPATPTRGEVVAGVAITIANGSLALPIGRGSLASFWASPAHENVLVVPGLLGSPLDFLGAQDLIASLAPTTRNIVLLAYPSGRGVAAIANELYDLIQANRQPGFGCSIVGHSLGGLVGRYLLERSASDPTRAGYQPGDPSLADTVRHLVLLGVPNAGSDLGDDLVGGLWPNVPPAERFLLQSAHDISYQPDALGRLLTAGYVDNATRYHLVYGDRGDGSDGVVTVASTLALPLLPPETLAPFVADHGQLHMLAQSLGITALLDQLLQAP